MAYVNFGKKNTRLEALASENKDKIFFPTDATSIILGGKEYGVGKQSLELYNDTEGFIKEINLDLYNSFTYDGVLCDNIKVFLNINNDTENAYFVIPVAYDLYRKTIMACVVYKANVDAYFSGNHIIYFKNAYEGEYPDYIKEFFNFGSNVEYLNIDDPIEISDIQHSLSDDEYKIFIAKSREHNTATVENFISLNKDAYRDLVFKSDTTGIEKLFENGEAYYSYLGRYYSKNIRDRIKFPTFRDTKIKEGSIIYMYKKVINFDEFFSDYINFDDITIDEEAFQLYKKFRFPFSKISDGEFIKFLIGNGEIYGSLDDATYYPLVSGGIVTIWQAEIFDNNTNPNIELFEKGNNPNNYIYNGVYGYKAINTGLPEDYYGRYDVFVNRSTDIDDNGYYAIKQVFVGREGNTSGHAYLRILFSRNNDSEIIYGPWINLNKESGAGKKTEGTGEIFNDYANNYAHYDHAHAEGQKCRANSYNAHAEGYSTIAGWDAHSEGGETQATGKRSHAEGDNTKAYGKSSHAEGQYSVSSESYSHAEGDGTVTFGLASHAEGQHSHTTGLASHAEGTSLAIGNYSHSEGQSFTQEERANESYINEDGSYKYGAIGHASHVEGFHNLVNSDYSHAEGCDNTINHGISNHIEGSGNVLNGDYCHVEGTYCRAEGICCHAEGNCTYAGGSSSHAEGVWTRTYSSGEHAEGLYNFPNSNYENGTIHTVGIGTSESDRKNAHEIRKTGDHYIYGIGGYDGKNSADDNTKTLQEVINNTVENYSALEKTINGGTDYNLGNIIPYNILEESIIDDTIEIKSGYTEYPENLVNKCVGAIQINNNWYSLYCTSRGSDCTFEVKEPYINEYNTISGFNIYNYVKIINYNTNCKISNIIIANQEVPEIERIYNKGLKASLKMLSDSIDYTILTGSPKANEYNQYINALKLSSMIQKGCGGFIKEFVKHNGYWECTTTSDDIPDASTLIGLPIGFIDISDIGCKAIFILSAGSTIQFQIADTDIVFEGLHSKGKTISIPGTIDINFIYIMDLT